jgi:dienelactone hydrolase
MQRLSPLLSPLHFTALFALPLLSVLASCASTGRGRNFGVEAHELSYDAGGVTLTGYLARPIDAPGPQPGILVVHEWWGHNDYVRRRAEQLAELGYVAFALDMYGDGKSASHPNDAQAFMQEVMGNAELMEARFRAALQVLQRVDGVDTERTGAIGYCMGGGIVLRMARSTDTLDAVASFHGSLGAALEQNLPAGAVGSVGAVLLANGADDPFVPQATIDALERELGTVPGMKQLVVASFPGAVHGFTNPDATKKGEEFGLPLRYDAAADAASWELMLKLFREEFGPR